MGEESNGNGGNGGNGGNSGNSGNGHHNNILKLPFQNKNSPNIIEAKIKFEQVYKIEENAEKYSTIGRKFYDHLFCENIDVFNEIEIPFSKEDGDYFIPNEIHGSDHVPMGMQFSYRLSDS